MGGGQVKRGGFGKTSVERGNWDEREYVNGKAISVVFLL